MKARNMKNIQKQVEYELKKAKEKWPVFYSDIIHAVSVMNEEAGESIQAALDYTYDGGSIENVRKELTQTAAMCFRCLENIEKMQTNKHLLTH